MTNCAGIVRLVLDAISVNKFPVVLANSTRLVSCDLIALHRALQYVQMRLSLVSWTRLQLRIDLTTLATERRFDRASAPLLNSAWFQSTIRKKHMLCTTDTEATSTGFSGC